MNNFTFTANNGQQFYISSRQIDENKLMDFGQVSFEKIDIKDLELVQESIARTTTIIDTHTREIISLEEFLSVYPCRKWLKMACITRHEITKEQHELAEEVGYKLHPIGDFNAFTVTSDEVKSHGDFDAVCVVHVAMGMRLQSDYTVACYENSDRSPVGEPPQFFATALHFLN